MWWQLLTERERERIEERIEAIGRWLMKLGAARSVSEDLLAHQLRSRLAALRDVARQRRRGKSRQLLVEIEAKVFELATLLLGRRR